jgi:hypothetical protein
MLSTQRLNISRHAINLMHSSPHTISRHGPDVAEKRSAQHGEVDCMMFKLCPCLRYLSFMPSFCFAVSGFILVAGRRETSSQLRYDHMPSASSMPQRTEALSSANVSNSSAEKCHEFRQLQAAMLHCNGTFPMIQRSPCMVSIML